LVRGLVRGADWVGRIASVVVLVFVL